MKELRQRIEQLEREMQTLSTALDHAKASPHRSRLAATRDSITHKFAIDQHEGYLTVGLFDDGRPGELFVRMAKEGSTMGGLMDTIGVLTSLALQYGVPIETLARKFEHVCFEPSGYTHNKALRRASSVIDYIFRWLGMQFSETYRQERTGLSLEEAIADHEVKVTTTADSTSVDASGHVDETNKETRQ
jgi:ribonucleoside-diphosphate reductase alpha chain